MNLCEPRELRGAVFIRFGCAPALSDDLDVLAEA